MRRLPLAIMGAAMALGLLASVAQAAPVTLSLSQMDELTAGSLEPPGGAIVLISISRAFSRSEIEGEGTVSSSAAASASVTLGAPASGPLQGND
jgi:hypothetical protein